MSNCRRWRANSDDALELQNKPARPFFSFTAPLYFQVQDQACVPFAVASSLAVLVNSQEQRVLYCDLLRLYWQPSRPSFFSLYGLAFLVNPRDKLIKTTWVAFHLKVAGIVVGKIEWTAYCVFLLLAWTQRNDYSPLRSHVMRAEGTVRKPRWRHTWTYSHQSPFLFPLRCLEPCCCGRDL